MAKRKRQSKSLIGLDWLDSTAPLRAEGDDSESRKVLHQSNHVTLDPFRTFSEWESEADQEAYSRL